MALPTEIQQYLGDGRLTARHARSLLSIDDAEHNFGMRMKR